MTEHLSIVLEHANLGGMESGIGALVRRKRNERGVTLTALAEEAGLSKGYLSTLESEKIGLPAPDVRRRLARALGITQVDLLIAAGELTREELQQMGLAGVIERNPNDVRTMLHEAVDAVPNWSAARAIAETLLAFMRATRSDQTDRRADVIAEPSASSGQGR